MRYDVDVIIIGAGGGGAVAAKELGELGVNVLVLEAGPWYGNKKWPNPNQDRGTAGSSSPEDLDVLLYKQSMNMYEENMNDSVSGRLRWGPADRRHTPWNRVLPKGGLVWQTAGIGGTTLHYFGNSPRAYAASIDNVWPISYKELIPFYEKVEATLPVEFSPVTPKEELFFYGAKKVGWSLIATLDVTSPGYRPQPNAILPPNQHLTDPNYSLEKLSRMEGCTLQGHCVNGCTAGSAVDKIAKRSTNVSYVPLALKTGNVTIRPNAFTTKILTEYDPAEGIRAIGVQYRNTWTGETEEVLAKAVVMAAGSVETPRLWLNSGLPHNPWVGRGLTNHYFDWVSGIFDEKTLLAILGSPHINSFIGHTSGGRFDYPGLGCIEVSGFSPGLMAFTTYATSQSGYDFMHKKEAGAPWDIRGRVVGAELKELMANYPNTLHLLVMTEDDVDMQNGVTLDPFVQDEHGPVPVVNYRPTRNSSDRRDQLARIAADILRKAGAKKVIRSDWSPGLFIHLESTMRMGFVTDSSGEPYQVKRLFIGDNSVHYNALGGPNPTATTQALATRMVEKMVEKYFS